MSVMGDRALGTSIRWASTLKSGYKVPTHPRIEQFLGWRETDEVVDVPVKGTSTHFAARIRETVERLGLLREEPWDRFNVSNTDQRSIVFCDRSSLAAKDWKNDKWLELAELLTTKGFKVAFETRGSLWTLEEQLKVARLVIGVDSGPLHLADYMGVDTLGLYGYTCPTVHGTLKPSSLTISRRLGVAGIEVDLVVEKTLEILQKTPQQKRETNV